MSYISQTSKLEFGYELPVDKLALALRAAVKSASENYKPFADTCKSTCSAILKDLKLATASTITSTAITLTNLRNNVCVRTGLSTKELACVAGGGVLILVGGTIYFARKEEKKSGVYVAKLEEIPYTPTVKNGRFEEFYELSWNEFKFADEPPCSPRAFAVRTALPNSPLCLKRRPILLVEGRYCDEDGEVPEGSAGDGLIHVSDDSTDGDYETPRDFDYPYQESYDESADDEDYIQGTIIIPQLTAFNRTIPAASALPQVSALMHESTHSKSLPTSELPVISPSGMAFKVMLSDTDTPRRSPARLVTRFRRDSPFSQKLPNADSPSISASKRVTFA